MQTLTLQQRIDHYAAAHGGQEPVVLGTGEVTTEPMTLYRVEMPNGHGPYNSELPNAEEIYLRLCLPQPVGWDCARFAREAHEQMGVTDLAFFKAHGNATYACVSEAAIQAWFPEPARRFMAGLGAKLVEYDLPAGSHVLRTPAHGEIVFVKAEANKVEERALI